LKERTFSLSIEILSLEKREGETHRTKGEHGRGEKGWQRTNSYGRRQWGGAGPWEARVDFQHETEKYEIPREQPEYGLKNNDENTA